MEIQKNKKEIEIGKDFEIWGKNFWDLTDKISIDLEIGKERQQEKFLDATLVQKFIDKYELDKETQVVYIDASKVEGGKSVGVVFEKEEIAYELSVNPKCTVFSEELMAIKNSLYNKQKR